MRYNESQLTKWAVIICFGLLAFYFATPAQAREPDTTWTAIGELELSVVLETYLDYEDKNEADAGIEAWVEGFLHGMYSTLGYVDTQLADGLMQCIRASFHTPASMRRLILGAGNNKLVLNLETGAFTYAILHIACDEVLGEYDYREDDEDTSS